MIILPSIDIENVIVSNLVKLTDERGTFQKVEVDGLISSKVESVAISVNPTIGTIRGLHFQIEPFAEEKLITCIQGSIFDVLVDLRPNSKTFGRWSFLELTSKNNLLVSIPKGVAHGFQTLEPDTIIQYCLTSRYVSQSAFSINPLADLKVVWPLSNPLISQRDSEGLSFLDAAKKYSDSLRARRE